MKHSTLFCLLVVLLFFSSMSCRRQYPDNKPPLERWLADDTEAALKVITDGNIGLQDEKLYDSIFNRSREVLLHFPDRPTGNRDTVVSEIGRTFSLLSEAAKEGKKIPRFIALLDSLQHSGSVYLREQCNYYLLSYRAYSLFLLDKEEAFELAKQFLELPPCPDLQQEMVVCNQMAEVCYQWGGSADMYIGLQERAVAAVRRCGADYTGFVRILSAMGQYYRLAGRYDKAVECLQEAYERYLKEGQEVKHVNNVKLMGDMGNLYSRLRLYDKALEMNARAIEASAPMELHNIMGDLYRMRALYFERSEQYDSSLYYRRQAIETMERTRYKPGMHAARYAYAIHFILHPELYPDSLVSACKQLETLYADSTDIPALFHVNDCFYYGLALTRTGEVQRGKRLMEQATSAYAAQKWNESLVIVYGDLMRLYVKEDMKDELAGLFPTYLAMRDTMEKKDKITAAMAANVRYETGRKEQENRALTAEVSLKERTLIYTRVILGLSVFLLVGAACLIVQYRRIRRQERETHLNELNRLLSAQRELNRRNEALSIELEQTTHTEVIDNVRQQLNPILLSGDDEVRFRQSFAALYPRYLPRLRARCPEITKSDELVCMLIYLKQNTDEVSLALGISRASVNSARSRIRKKLGMQKEESLDEYLQGIW